MPFFTARALKNPAVIVIHMIIIAESVYVKKSHSTSKMVRFLRETTERILPVPFYC